MTFDDIYNKTCHVIRNRRKSYLYYLYDIF